MDYTIRKIKQSEIHLLSDFLYEAIFIPEGVVPPPKEIINQPELQVYTSAFGSRDSDICCVAEVNDRIVGAVWVRIMKDYGHIDDETPSFAISLYKEYRGQGIGTALMKAMLNELKEKDYKQASLAVQKTNYALKLYKKLGFEIIDENDEEYIMLCQVKKRIICKIRKWELSDAADLAAVLSNKKIQDHLRDGLPYPYTEQDGADYISAMLSEDDNETFAFAITADSKVVGSIGAFRQQNIHRRTAELGYCIAEQYWGKGIMTEAVKQICKYVFDKSDIIRIYAEPFAYNAGSCRVLEKTGFCFEGILRSNAVKNGKVIDMKMYSLLKTET